MNEMYSGIWLGEAREPHHLPILHQHLKNCHDSKECLEIIVEILKLGDFTVKDHLIKIMNSSSNSEIIDCCVRLFLMVGNHRDFKNIDNFHFLADASEDVVETFAVYANRGASYQIVPYLLSLLELWEGTNSEMILRDSLDNLLGFYSIIGEDSSLEEIGEFFLDKLQESQIELYVYKGSSMFLGKLSKELLQRAYQIIDTGESLKMSIIPSMLSTISGLKCPVDYFDILESEMIAHIYSYVDNLIALEMIEGSKYFYGHLII